MSRALALGMILAATPAANAIAQDTGAWRDSVTRLTTAVRAIRDSLFEHDSTLVELGRRDGVVLSATPNIRNAALRATGYFNAQRARWFGTALPSPGGFRLVVRINDTQRLFARFGEYETGTIMLAGLPDTVEASRSQLASTMKDLGTQLVAGYSDLMFPRIGVPTTQWLVDPPPLHLSERDRANLAMYMVMTSSGKAERSCVDGALDRCAYALGIRVAPGSDLTDSYPLHVRADLFLTALQIGGSGAWSRLVAAHPTRAEDALAAASGLPTDSLLARWRNRIMELRPRHGPLQPGAVVLMVGWAGVLLLGTLGVAKWR